MPRPRKNPDDPKWLAPGSFVEIKPGLPIPQRIDTPACVQPWDLYFAAAMTGLIARGGTSMDALIKTARQYADEASKTLEGK